MNNERLNSFDDQTLIALIITQSASWRNILSILLMRHHSALLTRCYAYLRNREDAEDACQETELRVFRAIKKFRGDSSFRTWLYSIADRQCYDITQKRKRQIIDDHLHALIEIHEENLRKKCTMKEGDYAISNSIKKLSKQEQDIIEMRFYSELTLQEISVALNIGLSATKMRLYRAVDSLSVNVRTAETISCL